jgi:hypothetical protein
LIQWGALFASKVASDDDRFANERNPPLFPMDQQGRQARIVRLGARETALWNLLRRYDFAAVWPID